MSKIIGCKFDRDEIVVYGRSERPVDTHKSKILEEEERKIRRDDVIIVNTDFTNDAKFYVDDSCFDDNKMSSNVKWSVVYQRAFADAKIKGENVPSELWALNEGDTSIGYLGMNKHYKQGESLTVKLLGDSKSMYYYGYIQKVFVFTDKPEGGFTFYIIPVSKPCINFAHFENSEKNWQYGDVVNLSVHYHNLCPTGTEELYTQVFVIEDKGSNASITAEEDSSIDFDDLEKISVWKSDELTMPQIDKQSRGLNAFKEFTILIDYEKWRKGEVKEKKFSVIAVVYREEYNWGFKSYKVVAFRNFLAQPTTDLYQYDSKTLSVKDIDIKEGSISSRIRVEKDFMSEILAKREIEKNNMIQYIGDIKYTKREFDPCGYSKITIQDKEDKERAPLVIFDETALSGEMDKTDHIFSIIAGDERKDITITLDGLQTKNQFCQGLLLDEGQKHTIPKNVFQVEKVYSAFHDGKFYPTYRDDEHQHQQREAGIEITEANKHDTDVRKSDKAAANPSAVQQWTEGEDYEIVSDKEITLKLRYLYNKTYENAFEELLGYSADTAYSISDLNIKSIAWLARYIFMKNGCKQMFFLPISTCRYPNQIVKIEVYPDFEWRINFKYETKNPVYVGQSPNYKYRVFTTERNQNQKLSGERRKERSKNWKLKKMEYDLEFEASYKINGEDHQLIPGDGFPVLNAVRFFLKTYEIVKAITFADETEELESSIANGTALTFDGRSPERRMTQRWLQRKSKGLPFRIEIGMPSFSGGIHGKFAQSKKQIEKYGSFYYLEFAANPLFSVKGEVDLLFYAQFIGPIGQAMYRISQIVKNVNYLTLGAIHIDYYIYVGLKAELNVELKAVEFHSIDGWNGGEIHVYIPASLYVRAGVDVNVSIQGIGSVSAETKIIGEAKFESRVTYDKRSNKAPALIKFDGLDVKIIINLEAKSDNSEDSQPTNEEPDYITNLLEPKDPWEIEIL